MFDKVDCFRIQGKFAGRPRMIWIDMKTLLVRRIDEQVTFLDFRTETTTIYYPFCDRDIPDKMLEFAPPEM